METRGLRAQVVGVRSRTSPWRTDRVGLRASLLIGLAVLFGTLVQPARADLTTGADNVSGHRTSGPFGWDYSYQRVFDGKDVIKDVQINFSFHNSWGAHEILGWMQAAETALENQWNDKYRLRDKDTGKTYGVGVDVTFEGYDNGTRFDQTVNVWEDGKVPGPEPDRTNMTNWQWGDTGTVMSHEFGHMLGLYDEYAGGAQDPANPLDDADSLMGWGALKPNPTMPRRYFTQFDDFITGLNPTGDFALEYIPAPGALPLAAMGLAMIGLLRRRWPAA